MLAEDVRGIVIIAHCDEFRMPKPILRCPFQKLNRSNEAGFQPSTMLHVFGGEALSSSSFATLKEIRERNSRSNSPNPVPQGQL